MGESSKGNGEEEKAMKIFNIIGVVAALLGILTIICLVSTPQIVPQETPTKVPDFTTFQIEKATIYTCRQRNLS